MNKEIDGLNTPSQSRDLQKYLASNSEAENCSRIFSEQQKPFRASVERAFLRI